MERLWLKLCLLVWLAGWTSAAVEVAAASEQQPPAAHTNKPNIIFVLADDLGYGDLGCYGQLAIQTPNLDRLAQDGVRFVNHYAGCALGSPSRCCLLLGQHTGHSPVHGDPEAPLPQTVQTVASLLKQNGYKTALIGKWGIGYPVPVGAPLNYGFDYFFGFLDAWQAHNYYPDFLWRNSDKCPVRGNVVRAVGRTGVAIKKTQYVQDLLTAEALRFIEQNKKERFFLFLCFTIPHANIEAGKDGLEVPNDMPYSNRHWPQPQKNYAAMVTRLDYSVGRMVDLLKQLGLEKDTVVFFSSDNGPHADAGFDPTFFDSTGGLRGGKGQLYEGGIRVPLIVWGPGRVRSGQVSSRVSAFWDFLPTALELAGVETPKGVDGLSLAGELVEGHAKVPPHRFLYWEVEKGKKTQRAVRFDNWKAVRLTNGTVELYDLKRDPAEQKNVAGERPELVKRALKLMDEARQ